MLNLTELEQRAVDSTINLADGHPRHGLTESQDGLLKQRMFPEEGKKLFRIEGATEGPQSCPSTSSQDHCMQHTLSSRKYAQGKIA